MDGYYTVETKDAKYSAPELEYFTIGKPRLKLKFGSPPFAINHITIPLEQVVKVTTTKHEEAKKWVQEINDEIACNK